MDIQNINALSQSAKISRQNSTDSHSTEFQTYLDAFSEKPVHNDSNPVKPSGNIHEVQTVQFVNMVSPREAVAEKVGSVLDLFERYSQDLKNPNKTLKDIEPALLTMKHAADNLNKDKNVQGEKSHSLTQLINNLQVAASVEYFKFQRGDYI
ncbi:MAG: hypothetical protein OMM_08651 [Candidatus Magnetoglobus multicellularis str. Araruama]|uniref:Uncharacterized protein n=1 Tax=Candidatus Magnetoglobus multicellularis str. Araruama TaxID=890399 RepID=A0A1V1P7A4_9BACT|nr:MAG: hypothetical protein OMM_08651 [Candidatus Magnetoglobus multicellularis str. Araruama]